MRGRAAAAAVLCVGGLAGATGAGASSAGSDLNTSHPSAPAACTLAATHTQAPEEIALGDVVHVELKVTTRCTELPGRRFMLAAPAWESPAAAGVVRAALDGFVDAAAVGVGLALGHVEPPVEVAPTMERGPLHSVLASYGAATGGSSLADLIGSGRAVLFASEAGEAHDHIVVLDHAAVPQERESRLRFEVESTLDLGIEITQVCVGGGCPYADGVERIDVASVADVEAALVAIAQRPTETGLRRLEVRQVLGPAVDYMFPSANIPPSAMATGSTGNFIGWDAPRAQDELIFSFDVRPFATGPVDVVGMVTVGGMDPAGTMVYASANGLGPVTVRPEPARPTTCHLLGTAAAPETAMFGETITETLTLATDCAATPRSADVVLAFDTSSSMRALPADQILRAAERFVDKIDLSRSRVAVMMFNDDVDVRTGLISDRAALLGALDPMTHYGDTALGRALDAGREILDDRRPGALPVIVLLTDGQVRDDPGAAAAWAHAAGIRVALVCFSPTLRCDDEVFEIASSQYLFFARDGSELIRAYDTLAQFLTQPDIERLSVSQAPVDAFTLRRSPPPRDPPSLGAGGELVWNRAEALTARTVLEVPLVAGGLGEWPVAESITAYWLDNVGGVGAAMVPVPRVRVQPPPDTGPCAPHTERTVAPAAVQPGGLVTETTKLDVTCRPSEAPLDVVFAIDHSFSMGTLGRLENAVRAVETFLAEPGPGGEAWPGLVAFNESVTHRVPVGPDPGPLLATLRGLRPDGSTDIGRAIDAAVEEVLAGRPGAQRAIVVVTDGDNSASGVPILAAAARAKERGVLVVTVCAGGRCGADLALAASQPEYASSVPDAADLAALFARLARVLAGVTPAAQWVTEQLPNTTAYVGASPEPTLGGPFATSLQWTLGAQPEGGFALQTRLRPSAPGRHPVALWTAVQYALHGGLQGTYMVAAPEVDVAVTGPPGLPTTAPVPTVTPYVPPAAHFSLFLPFGERR